MQEMSGTITRRSVAVESVGMAALRQARLAVNLTAEQLAVLAGVTSRTVERIENGQVQRPHRATLAAIAQALEMAGER